MIFRNFWRACISFGRPHQLAKNRSFCRAYTHSEQPNQDNADHENFYKYTSGRWLWDEDARLQERYKHFDVPALKDIAARAVGAKACVTITKLAEGGFNKVFRLVMDDDSVVIARIPMPNAGPPFLTVASEVATMDFVSTRLRHRNKAAPADIWFTGLYDSRHTSAKGTVVERRVRKPCQVPVHTDARSRR